MQRRIVKVSKRLLECWVFLKQAKNLKLFLQSDTAILATNISGIVYFLNIQVYFVKI